MQIKPRHATPARWLVLLIFALVLMLAVPAWGQDLEKAQQAFRQGDYATALKEFRPLAEQGDKTSQTALGFMYLFGTGVPQLLHAFGK